MRLKYAAAALQLLASAPVLAWSEETHMTTGAMAFDDIAATNPELLAQIKQIILAHPHYKQLSAHAGAAQGSAKTRVIFEYLARWPDDMNGTMYEHRDWHYELRVVHGRTWLWPFRNGNASEGFDINYRIFADKKAADVDRAIALGWLLHIIGDIQQPLHAGHQMTSAFSATDEAGTKAFIRKDAAAQPTDLHQYWDKILDVAGPVDATANFWSLRLPGLWSRAKITELSYPGLPQQQFSSWLDESMFLAKKYAYRGTLIEATPVAADAPVAKQPEIRFAEELSKRRVATGGYRIADTIRMALKNK
jgi:hypothetical protein